VAVLFAAIARRWDFPVPRSSDARCLFRMTSRRLRSPRRMSWDRQKNNHKIAHSKPMISIDKRTRCRELAPGSQERSTLAAAPPNTRRRLSGWSSKIKTCCTVLLPAELVGGSCTACLMIKNLFVPVPSRRPRERKRNGLAERSSAGSLRTGALNVLARWWELLFFIAYAIAGHHIAAMARQWDLFVLLTKTSLLPHSR